MLDLLLDRAHEAHDVVMQSADAIPSELELMRIRLSDEFLEMMLEVVLAVAAYDGHSTLSARKDDLVVFRDLFAEIMWQINSQHQMLQHHLHQLLCAKCRENLRKSKWRNN